MKSRLALILGFFCWALLVTGCWAGDPYVWDFGAVKEGQIVKHNFVLKNTGKETLNIKDVTTSCGCTVSTIAKKTLLAAEKTLIGVEFHSQGYSGPVQQFIYVHTDNPEEPIIKFIVKANIVKKK